MGADKRVGVPREPALWLLDPMSSTHNESRLAACPLSGVPGRVRAPCQLILGQVGKCAVRTSTLDEAVNKRFLSTGETGYENAGSALTLGVERARARYLSSLQITHASNLRSVSLGPSGRTSTRCFARSGCSRQLSCSDSDFRLASEIG